MGGFVKGNRLSPEAVQKINELVNASIEKNIKGKTGANMNEADFIKQTKAEVNKQIAPYLKEGVDNYVKNLIDATVDKTIEECYKRHKSPRKRLPIEY